MGAQKFLAALSAAVGVLVAQGVLEGQAATYTTVIISALGAGLVYLVSNKDSNGNPVNMTASDVEQAVQMEKVRVEANSVPMADELSYEQAATIVLDEDLPSDFSAKKD